ncbi:hypothetical protein [Glycomyces sp. NPDC048151]|uniref:hypothetical protein n=1 Tax=Glycomyces sp. NPDC048151 TaxID=3364002 RepID=UPI00371565D4
MTVDPEDDKVAAAFASFRAESAAQFPPPPVNELLGRAPAAQRRRRLVSLAAVVGACTAVTAGGFAVASTIGPIAFGPQPADETTTIAETSASEEAPTLSIGDPASPQSAGDEGETPTTAPLSESFIVIPENAEWDAAPDEWSQDCGTGPQEADLETWTITADTGWRINDSAQDPGTAAGDYQYEYGTLLDLDADGAHDDVLLELACGDTASGVGAFTWVESESTLELIAWVWEPEGSDTTVDIQSVEDGVIGLGGYESHPETWSAEYVWDPAAEDFVVVEDEATSEPTPTESATSSAPSETPTADESTAAASSSGS